MLRRMTDADWTVVLEVFAASRTSTPLSARHQDHELDGRVGPLKPSRIRRRYSLHCGMRFQRI